MTRQLLLSLLVLLATSTAWAEDPAHDREFWRGIVESDYAVPEGESAVELLGELSQMLASTDPELRDRFGYEIPARWIYRDKLFSAEELREVLAQWSGNLVMDEDTAGHPEAVLLRSFAALDLSILAAYDNLEPFLSKEEFDGLLDRAVGYFLSEQDTRGFDPEVGWVHPLAHTSDLLKFLSRSRHLESGQQAEILAAIAARAELPDGSVYAWGEGERFARVVLSLVMRDDFDRPAFSSWVENVAGRAEGLWEGDLDTRQYAAVQNAKQILLSLHALLSGLDEPSDSTEFARQGVLEALDGM